MTGEQQHKIFVAESMMNPSVGHLRYRAFCRCGWDSENTDSRTTLDKRISNHLNRSDRSGGNKEPAIDEP